MRRGLGPPLLQPVRGTSSSATRLGDGRVAAGRPGVGQQRVGAVEQPELAVLERLDVVGERGAGVLPARAPARERAAEHPLAERLGDDRAPGRSRPCRFGHERTSSGVGPRRDPVDHRRDDRDRLVDPGGEAGVDQLGQVAHHAADHRAVAGQVVAGHERERAGVGPPPGGEARDQPGRERCARARVGSRRRASTSARTSGWSRSRPPSARAQIAGLGDRDRHRADVGRGEVAEPGVVVVGGVDAGEAVDHLEPVAVGGAGDQRVEAVLGGERVGQSAAAAGEGGDAPVARVRGVVGVPGLVGAEEVARARGARAARAPRRARPRRLRDSWRELTA